jgi:ribosomal protein S27AE
MSGGRGDQRFRRGGTFRRGTRARPVQHEKVEQAQILALCAVVAEAVWTLGTRRGRGKACPACGTFVAEHQGLRQTPGHPDLVIFLRPRPGDPDGVPALLYWETKAGRNATSADQDRFLALAARCGVAVGVGDYQAFVAYLIAAGRLKVESVPHYRVRIPPFGELQR